MKRLEVRRLIAAFWLPTIVPFDLNGRSTGRAPRLQSGDQSPHSKRAEAESASCGFVAPDSRTIVATLRLPLRRRIRISAVRNIGNSRTLKDLCEIVISTFLGKALSGTALRRPIGL